MSQDARTPSELLAELGVELGAAFRQGRARQRRHARRALTVVVALVALGGSMAAATRSIFSSASLPRLTPVAAVLATSDAPLVWQMSVSRCARDAGVHLLLRTKTVRADSACGPLLSPPGMFYGPHRGGALAFGAAPAGTRRVELTLGAERRVALKPIDANADALRAARLSAQAEVYVARLPAGAVITAVTGFDGSGHLVFACHEQRCTEP